MSQPVHDVIATWHEGLVSAPVETLDRLLADDVVFVSPILHTPQRGKAITMAYLMAAFTVLDVGGAFRYVDEVIGDRRATLEFETEIDGVYVNGVDLITVDHRVRIVEFKVMLRPLRAIEAVQRRMAEMLTSG